jgi:hypothetical protein
MGPDVVYDIGMALDSHVATSRASPRALALLALTAAALSVAAAGIMFLYPGDTSNTGRTFLAGPESDFKPGSVTYFEHQHFYLVRLKSGEFLALYDVDPRQQTFPRPAGTTSLCRVKWYPDGFPRTSFVVDNPRLAGLESGVFREPCHGSTFSAAGERLFGPAPAGLDTFPVSAGEYVHVDLSRRVCTPYSNTVSGLAGQRSCRANRSP